MTVAKWALIAVLACVTFGLALDAAWGHHGPFALRLAAALTAQFTCLYLTARFFD